MDDYNIDDNFGSEFNMLNYENLKGEQKFSFSMSDGWNDNLVMKDAIEWRDADWISFHVDDDDLIVSNKDKCEMDSFVDYMFAFYLFLIATVSITLAFV